MQQTIKNIRGILIYTVIVLLVSVAYYIYAYTAQTIPEEHKTFLTKIGKKLGEAGMWLLIFIYCRTLLKLILGQGKLAQRLLPDYVSPVGSSALNQLLAWLNRTHIYFGIAAVAVILLHIFMMDFSRYSHILFFPALLGLVIWQGVFGLFLTLRFSTAELKKFSYLVHAQFVTGIAIGIFAWLGHVLIDD
ncbi:hypothetical protein [Nitrosomonas sp.]|uniref:hypothetical protein n=1 Tax=Nitrosomonas sp. TaxID=42353 RepID=UPI0025F36002|nr:hypothetical protein [Nitrosomonas sp.]MCC6916845.1 hypothetical protein [Nitrosomonas sp.]